jgi:hypothetical protein
MTSQGKRGGGAGVRRHLELGAGASTLPWTGLLLAGVLALQLVMIGSYVGALHAPKPRGVPIAVVGPPASTAPLVARLSAGNVLRPRSIGGLAAARAAIDDREVYAALVPGRGSDQLLVASAASSTVAELLPVLLRRGEPAGRRLSVRDVKPLPSADPRGLSPFYLVVGWLVGGYVAATVLGLARGGVARGRRRAAQRLAALAAYALASGLLGTLVVQQIVGVLPGHTLALAAAGSLIVFATGAASAALQALFGIAGTALAILLFVALGNPASGGPLTTELLMPAPWRTIGPLLPPGAGTTLTRNIAYFDGNATSGALVVLALYCLVGSLIVVLAAGRSRAAAVAGLAGRRPEEAAQAAPEASLPVQRTTEEGTHPPANSISTQGTT